jgi:hypothetical protein
MLYGAAPAFIVAAVIAQIILPPHLKPAYLIGDFGGSTERAEIEAKQAAAVEFAMLQAAAAANAQANAQMETEVSRKEQEIIAESLAAQSTGAVIADFSCFLGSLIPRDTYGDLQTAGQVMRGGCGFGDKLRNNIVQAQAEAARQGSAILQRPTPASSNPAVAAQPARQAKPRGGPNFMPLVPASPDYGLVAP